MPGQWGDLKTVVTAAAVMADVEHQSIAFPRLPEAWDALEWVLARSAETVGRAPNNGDQALRLYAQEQDLLANIPAIWIVYKIGEQIEILAAKMVPPQAIVDDNQ